MKVGGAITALDDVTIGGSAKPYRIQVHGAAYNGFEMVSIKGWGNSTSSWSIVTYDSGNNEMFSLNDDGDGYFYGDCSAASIIDRSSKKFKTDIETIDGVTLPKIMNLVPVLYKRIGKEDDIKEAGFIAEDVQKEFPNVVRGIPSSPMGKDRDALGIAYGRITPYLAKGISEQQVYIDALADRIENIEQQLLRKVA